MHKIFFHNKLITLSSAIVSSDKSIINLEYENSETIKFALKIIEDRDEVSWVNIIHTSENQLLQKMINAIKFVMAAGGIVKNENGEFLLIFRNGRWDIPKGKLKRGEDPKSGGLREVEEECNVKDLVISGELHPTYHIYDLKGRKLLKKTFWYEMKCEGVQELIPQTEEGITEVRWFRKEELDGVLKNTFNSITDVLKEVMQRN
jgi:8-oxo-dGTP pyrophosphatase MutT (NUDIX family)